MSAALFGTDGIRARFGEEPLVGPTVRRIGAALGEHLARRSAEPTVLLAGDTRASSRALAAWIASGLAARGARAVDLGTLPTAAVARLVPATGAAAGVVLSASHNPASDNGIKLVAADGYKWRPEEESELEQRIATIPSTPEDGGAAERDSNGLQRYLEALHAEFPGRPLAGLRVALDCANGAASGLAAELFETLGAATETLFDRPDGSNINAGCGSTHPDSLIERVRGGSFDVGFAFDGDADRALLVDGGGALRDGDAMLYLWAADLLRSGGLTPPAIVATSMSNLGLEHGLERLGVGVLRCGVGDREVVATLLANGLRLGGEQSGHLVDLRRATTGDGLLTAIAMADLVARAGRPVVDLLRGFVRYPQRIENVRVARKPALETLPKVVAAAREVERQLGHDGRLVLRYSGTEPLARIMLEGPEESLIRSLAAQLADAIRAEIGAA